MKKLLKKKVNVFGKGVPVLAIFVLGIALVSAALVPYLSNTFTGNVIVDSPLEIYMSGASDGVVITHNPEGYSVSLYGGESYWIETTLTNNVDGLTGYIAEGKIVDFDGEGITMFYYDPITSTLAGEIPSCSFDNDWYYYLGDPEHPLPAGELISKTTVETAINLEPRVYTSEARIVTVDGMACTP